MTIEKYPTSNLGSTSLLLHASLLAGVVLGWIPFAHAAEVVNNSSQVSSLRLAPIRFAIDSGGSINYILQRTTSNNNTQASQSLVATAYTGIKARSFIWQPWLATVQAGASLGVGKGFSTSNSNLYNSSKSTSLNINGNAALQLIPRSRFPFEAVISISRDRQNSGVASSNSVLQFTVMSLTQQFLSRNGNMRGNISLTRDIANDLIFVPNRNDTFALNFQHIPFLLQRLQVEANIKRSILPRYNSRVLTKKFSLKHSFRPSASLSTNTIISLDSTKVFQANTLTGFESRQFTSFGNWASPNRALNLIGSVRVYALGGNSTSTITKGTNLNLNTAYTIAKGLRAGGTLNISDNNLDGQNITTTVSLTSSKNLSDVTNNYGLVYRRYIGTTILSQNKLTSNSVRNAQGSNSTVSLTFSAGHSLTKQSSLLSSPLISNINQVASTVVSTNNTSNNYTTLSTSGSVSWSPKGQLNSRSSTVTRLNVSDTRAFGNDNRTGTTQLYTVQASRIEAMPRNQTLAGNITLQQVNQSATLTTPSRSTLDHRAAITYQHSRLFRILGLKFSSALSIRRTSQLNALNEDTRSWDNNLNYIIGALELNFRVNFEKNYGRNLSVIRFTAKRTF